MFLRKWDDFVARISVFRSGTNGNVSHACGCIYIRSQIVPSACLGLRCSYVSWGVGYRFALLVSVWTLYCNSMNSMTSLTGILGQFMFHFEIVPMSHEWCTNGTWTSVRDALTSKYSACYWQGCEDPDRCSCLSFVIYFVRSIFCTIRALKGYGDTQSGPAGSAMQQFVRISNFGQHRLKVSNLYLCM